MTNNSQPLTFDVKRCMYVTCKRIIGRIGLAGAAFAEGFYRDLDQLWEVAIYDAEGREVADYVVHAHEDFEASIEHVQALMSLEYSARYLRRAAA